MPRPANAEEAWADEQETRHNQYSRHVKRSLPPDVHYLNTRFEEVKHFRVLMTGYLRDSDAVLSVGYELYTTVKTLVSVVRTQQLPFMAAALAYYAFLSAVPLVIIAVTVTTMLAGETLAAQVSELLGEFLTPDGVAVLEQTLVQAPGRGGLTVAGFAVLVWGSLRVFRGLDTAFSSVYGNVRLKPITEQLRDGILALAGVGLAVGITVALGTLGPLVGRRVASLLSSFGLFLVLPVVFFPLYYVLPARDVTVREAIPGAVFAGVAWSLLGAAFGLYTSVAGGFQLYGVLAGVLLLLVWFYFGGLVLLVGVALNAVLAERPIDRQLQQGPPRQHRQRATMSEFDGPTDDNGTDDGTDEDLADDVTRTEVEELRTRLEEVESMFETDVDDVESTMESELTALREKLDAFEEDIDDRTVHREEIERDLKQYVRRRMRRGHATGWGPYLVLLYGTAMTLGAFYFLGGVWAILAMLVIWLSTLGLYTLMVLVGITFTAAGLSGRVLDVVRSLRNVR